MHFYCAMNPLEICILDDDKNDLQLMKRSLESHSLKPEIEAFQEPEQCYNHIRKARMPAIIYFDYKMPSKNGIECARVCRELGWDGVAILTTGKALSAGKFPKDIDLEAWESEVIDCKVAKDQLCKNESAQKALEDILKSGKCAQPLVVGIYGAGDQGRGIGSKLVSLKNARGMDCVSSIKYFSHFWEADDEAFFTEYLPDGHMDHERKKEICCKKIDEFFGQPKIDVLFITTGTYKRLEKWNRREAYKLSRAEIKRPLLEGSVHKIKRLMREIEEHDFQGICNMITNVPEIHLLHFYRKNYLRYAYTMTHVSADLDRLKTAYRALDSSNIERAFGPNVGIKEINFPMTGEHGGEIPLLKEGYITRAGRTITLPEINPEIADLEKRFDLEREVAKRSRTYGMRAATYESIYGSVAEGTIEAAAEFVRKLASFAQSFYGSHIIQASRITGSFKDKFFGLKKQKIGIDYRDSRINCSDFIESPPEQWKGEVLQQIVEQDKLYGEFYGPV